LSNDLLKARTCFGKHAQLVKCEALHSKVFAFAFQECEKRTAF